MNIELTTNELKVNEREAFWRHVMSDTFAPVAIREMAEGDVAGSIRGRWVGRRLVTDVQSTGQDIRRTPRLISEADNAYFQVAVVASGTGRISQDGRQAVLRPGDCVLYETTRPFQWLFHSDWDVWVFSLPSESVRLSDSERRLISSRRLDGADGLTGVVSRFLIDLARHSEDLPAEQSERVLAHVSDLVVTLLSDQLDDSARVRGPFSDHCCCASRTTSTSGFKIRPSGQPRSPPRSTSPPGTCTSSSKPITRPSRCTSNASASPGPAMISWTRGWLAARSPRSRTPAASAT